MTEGRAQPVHDLTTTGAALDRVVGESPGMQRVREQIRRIAGSPVPVLIVGETGTGKEICAEAIAQLSQRRPFLAMNCAALPEHLVESELFGHERGAFTGAVRAHPGVIAAVNGGTLFLDELADIPTYAQAKLLRTLESGEYRPLGSTRTMRSRFRILAATSGDLRRILSAGQLRTDLFHRLGAIRICIPPLRDRREDIPALVRNFLRLPNGQGDRPPEASLGALDLLMARTWPGNVRELRNVVEASAAVAVGEATLQAHHVREVIDPFQSEPGPAAVRTSLAEVRQRAERQAIEDALRLTGGNRERAARLLRISEATLYRRLVAADPSRSPGSRTRTIESVTDGDSQH